MKAENIASLPNFWGLFQSRNKQEERERKACAKALYQFWKRLKLPKELPSTEELNKWVDGIEDVGYDWNHLGGTDSEVSQGLFTLIAEHYNVSLKDVMEIWLGRPWHDNADADPEGNSIMEDTL